MTELRSLGDLVLPAVTGLRARHFDPDRDYEPLADMIAGANRADGLGWAPNGDGLRHEWSYEAGLDPARDAVVVERGGEIVAAAWVLWRDRDDVIIHRIAPVVRHDHRRRGIGSALVAWAEAHARETVRSGHGGPPERPHEFVGWSDLGVPGLLEFAARHGYAPIRYFNVMVRDLAGPIPELPLPEGLEVRPVVEADHRRIFDADVEAFRDHFGSGPPTEEEYAAFFTGPAVDTSLWQVAWDGAEVAGSVVATIDHEENERLGLDRGWLDHVSVRRPWRRRGLASALIVRALVRLRDRGVGEAALGVDTENATGALGVYERLGFRRQRTSAVFQKPF